MGHRELKEKSALPLWIDDRYPPELYLFLSVDIEGSTKFKNSVEGGPSTWGPFFLEFFRNFPPALKERETVTAEHLSLTDATQFELWKTLGDELLFYKKLGRGLDAFVGIIAATQALMRGAEMLRRHGEARAKSGETNQYPTQLKGTAWIAGFPIKNMQVGSNPKEFIGPSIDLGFRLAKISSPSRMVLSAPLAWLVSKIQHEQSSKLDGLALTFFYFGREALKGVGKEDSGYPVFWIDVSDAARISKTERDLIRRGRIEPKDVVEFCESLFEDPNSGMGRPFILGDKDNGLGLPHHKTKELKGYKNAYRAFLTTVPPVVSELHAPNTSGTGDAALVISAIDSAAMKKRDKH